MLHNYVLLPEFCYGSFMEDMHLKLGPILKKHRESKNFSQMQLANRLSVARQRVSHWELDLSIPSIKRVVQICQILRIKPGDFIQEVVEFSLKNPNKE